MFGAKNESYSLGDQHKLTRRRIHASGSVNATIAFEKHVAIEPAGLREVADKFGAWRDWD